MEDLALVAAGVLGLLILFGVADVVLAILARKRIIKYWIAIVVNSIVGLLAIWGISIAWGLGMVPFIGVAISSIILTFPTKKKS